MTDENGIDGMVVGMIIFFVFVIFLGVIKYASHNVDMQDRCLCGEIPIESCENTINLSSYGEWRGGLMCERFY